MMPSLDQIDAFLTERFGPVADLSTLQAGGWSSAYGFVVESREWVLRVGHQRHDFEVGPDGSITAVFDWGNALAGDPLYDIAWIVYCIPWFPAIDRQHVLELAQRHFPDDELDRLLPLYELHIALGELQYAAFREDVSGMDGAAGRLEHLVAGTERR